MVYAGWVDGSAWIALAAALAGALVGGFASTMGAIWQSRRELTRRNRVALYQDILPSLLDDLRGGEEQAFTLAAYRRIQADLDRMHRMSTVAGRADRRNAEQIRSQHVRSQRLHNAYNTALKNQLMSLPVGASPEDIDYHLGDQLPPELHDFHEDYREMLDSTAGAIRTYSQWLERRIR